MAGPLAVNQHSGELTRVGGGGDGGGGCGGGGGGCGGGAALGAGVGMGASGGVGALPWGYMKEMQGHLNAAGADDRFDTPDPLFFGC